MTAWASTCASDTGASSLADRSRGTAAAATTSATAAITAGTLQRRCFDAGALISSATPLALTSPPFVTARSAETPRESRSTSKSMITADGRNSSRTCEATAGGNMGGGVPTGRAPWLASACCSCFADALHDAADGVGVRCTAL